MLRGYRGVFAAIAGLAAFVTALGAGAFFGALYAPHYGYQAEHPAHRSPQAEKGNPSQIDRDRAGLPYIAERIAAGPDPDEGTEREKRDLAAQEASALWAFWLLTVSSFSAIVTMVATGLLLWQIILTRKAVEDTGEATEAMREANAIARQAQRPWVSISVKPTILETRGAAFRFEAEVLLTNKGSMVAKNLNIGWELVWSASIKFEEVTARLARFGEKRATGQKILIPGDTETFRYWKGTAKSELPWGKPGQWREGEVGAVFLISVHYQSEGSGDEWHHTDQAYLVCYRSNGEIHSGISKSLRSIKADRLLLEPITAGTLGK
jgi:hypothetical protein